jgi:hypothetical protein
MFFYCYNILHGDIFFIRRLIEHNRTHRMATIDRDAEQHRLLTELNKIDMPEELWLQLAATLRQWIAEQKESDRRWQLHEKEYS